MTDANSIEKKKQQYQRLNEIFTVARQRYLDDGGDPRRAGGGLEGNDYLTEEEKQEIRYLGNEVFGAVPTQKSKLSKGL